MAAYASAVGKGRQGITLPSMNPDALHAEVVQLYADHVNPSLARLMNFAGFGVEVEASGCTIVDHEGREFLDCLGGYGVFSFGHRHPRIVDAVKRQLDAMPLSAKTFFNRPQALLAKRLAELAPPGLEMAFFCNSGAEAVEAALKFARAATGRHGVLAFSGGYHGKTMGALSVTGREKFRSPFAPMLEGVQFAPFGDLTAARQLAGEGTAAIIVEAVQGEGGIHVAPPGFLAGLRQIADETGALLIIDEVQTGLGRTGSNFASGAEGVSPDLMPLAKALGGGVMPIGACLGTKEVWEKVFGDSPLIHTSTFGGSPLACAAGLAALDVLVEEDLAARAATLGSRFLEALRKISSPLIADVRGRGLLIGVEFAEDEVGELVIGQMVKRGVVAAYTLNNPRVIRLEPPLIIAEEQIDFAARVFGEAVKETEELLAGML